MDKILIERGITMDERKYKPIIWKAILCVIPCWAIFFLTRTLLALLIGLVEFIIYKIPILGDLLMGIFAESAFSFFTIIPIFVAYWITTLLQEKMMKYAPTITLSRRILGVIMALAHLCFLIINIFADGNYPINIFCIIAALAFVFSNNEY